LIRYREITQSSLLCLAAGHTGGSMCKTLSLLV
jgi:hypothetical protein